MCLHPLKSDQAPAGLLKISKADEEEIKTGSYARGRTNERE